MAPDDFALAAALIRGAGDLAARMLREGLTTEHKTSISDEVSAADHATESFVVERLRAECPDDAFSGGKGRSDSGAGQTWYVDPADDGTYILSGLSTWCAAVALDDALGTVYPPATDELWLGGADRGTRRHGVEVLQLVDRPLAKMSVGGAAEVIETCGHRWGVAGPRRVVDKLSAVLVG